MLGLEQIELGGSSDGDQSCADEVGEDEEEDEGQSSEEDEL